MGRIAYILPVVLALPMISCDEHRNRFAGAPSDSGGVLIASNGLLEPGRQTSRLAELPLFEVGAAVGDPVQELHGVRGAVRLRDGTIAIANGGTHEVRAFRPDGTLSWSFGRRGGGPGEFEVMDGLWAYRADSLLVWDRGLHRYTVIAPDGEFARSGRITSARGYLRMVGALSDGSFILATDQLAENWKAGPHVRSTHVLHYSSDGDLLNEIGAFPLERVYPVPYFNGATLAGHEIFGPRTQLAIVDDRIVIGTGVEDQLEVFEPDGERTRLVRWTVGDREVRSQHLTAWKDAHLDLSDTDEGRRRRRFYIDQLPSAPRFPSLSAIVAGHDRQIWVRRYRRPGEDRELWWIFDRDGRYAGQVEAPEGFAPYQIGADYVLGSVRDPDGVELVRMYSLQQH